MINPVDLQKSGFGTLFALLNSSGSESGFDNASTTTTNAVPQLLYSKTLAPHSVMTLRVALVCKQNSTNVGKFVREFTVSRNTGNATLLQELVPSPDVKTNQNLDVSCNVDGTNAVINVTGIAATVIWHGLVELVS
jgi:hypothetical protein